MARKHSLAEAGNTKKETQKFQTRRYPEIVNQLPPGLDNMPGI
jgi:hypothetical protein